MDIPETARTAADYVWTHAYLFLGALVVLVVIIVIYYSRGGKIPFVKRRRTRKSKLCDDDEIDDLIESIHNKQKRRPTQ